MTAHQLPDETARPDGRAWRIPPIRSLATLLVGEGASRILSFVAIALLTRRLGPAAWAPIAVGLTVVQFGNLFVEAGLRLLGAREVARDAGQASRLVRPIVSTQTGIALVLFALALVAAVSGVAGRDLGPLLPGFAASLIAFPFFLPWLFQGLGEMRWVAIPQVARYAAFLALSALVVTSPSRAVVIPWIEAASMAGGAAIALGAARRFGIGVSVGRAAAFDGTMVREAMPIAASQLIWVARTYLPIVALWYVAPRTAVAQFDVAHRLLMVLQAGLAVYLTNLYTPLSRAVDGPRRAFSALLLGSALLSGVGALAVALLLAAYPAPILGALFGGQFSAPAAVAALTVLAFVGPVITLRGHFHYALVALGRQGLELRCSIIAGIALVVLLALWVPGSGVRGAAMAMLLSESLGLLLTAMAVVGSLRGMRPGASADPPSASTPRATP